ncbi:hypothetical protein L208DRAFT_1269244, partial [Tricholoma matsutake]
EEQAALGENVWAPFASQEEWDLSQWLMRNVGQNSINMELHGEHSELSFHNTYSFLKKIDQLPTGPEWICDSVAIDGDHAGEDGMKMSEDLELWHCDPVECIQELLGIPALNGDISYTPVQYFTDKDGTNCVINKGWTADWWWKMQVREVVVASMVLFKLIFPGQNS